MILCLLFLRVMPMFHPRPFLPVGLHPPSQIYISLCNCVKTKYRLRECHSIRDTTLDSVAVQLPQGSEHFSRTSASTLVKPLPARVFCWETEVTTRLNQRLNATSPFVACTSTAERLDSSKMAKNFNIVCAGHSDSEICCVIISEVGSISCFLEIPVTNVRVSGCG